MNPKSVAPTSDLETIDNEGRMTKYPVHKSSGIRFILFLSPAVYDVATEQVKYYPLDLPE